MGKKFLIGQLACYGDILYATTIAKQIKNDFPDSHVTWAVASKYKSILSLNPFIDHIWEVQIANNDFYGNGWSNFKAEAEQKKSLGIFDEIFYTQLNPRWDTLDGSIRSSTLRGYNRPITVDVSPVVRLSDLEVANVSQFAAKNNLDNFKEVVLFECAPGSGQSFINIELALQIAEYIVDKHNNVCFIISSPTMINHSNPNIIDASELSYRENAELTKYCTLLIGCSSGITWISTSDWAKKLNMLQLLNRDYRFFAGIKYDFSKWNISTDNVIEITVNDIDHITDCILNIFEENFHSAKLKFDEVFTPQYFNFKANVNEMLLSYNGSALNKIKKANKIAINYSQANPHLSWTKITATELRTLYNFYAARFTYALKSKIKAFFTVDKLGLNK